MLFIFGFNKEKRGGDHREKKEWFKREKHESTKAETNKQEPRFAYGEVLDKLPLKYLQLGDIFFVRENMGEGAGQTMFVVLEKNGDKLVFQQIGQNYETIGQSYELKHYQDSVYCANGVEFLVTRGHSSAGAQEEKASGQGVYDNRKGQEREQEDASKEEEEIFEAGERYGIFNSGETLLGAFVVIEPNKNKKKIIIELLEPPALEGRKIAMGELENIFQGAARFEKINFGRAGDFSEEELGKAANTMGFRSVDDIRLDGLKKVYRGLAKEWHPDKNPGHEGEAGARFQEIQKAYELLLDYLDQQPANEAKKAA